MAKKKNITSKMNGLFRFNESDMIQGFYAGTAEMKHGRAILISDLGGDIVIGVPAYTTINKLPEKIQEGDYLRLVYKGTEKSEHSGMEYMNIEATVWELESEDEKAAWNAKGCNVKDILDALPEWEPGASDVGSQATLDEDDYTDEVPF